MSLVRVSIGPVSSASARAWAAAARETLATVRSRPDLGVPQDVVDAFDLYVDLWGVVADTTDPFVWASEVDPDLLTHLASHWARLINLARADPEGTGIRPAPPEGEAFYNALATALIEATAAVETPENIADRLEDVIPSFHESLLDLTAPDARRVLIVDDNEDIRLLMRIAIERDERLAVCGEAENGSVALGCLQTSCPDAILLDLSMPVMDGLTALPLIKQHCPDVDVIVFSAAGDTDTLARVMSLGAATFLNKTADAATVMDALAGR